MNNYYRREKRVTVVNRSFMNRNYFLMITLATLFAIAHLWLRTEINHTLVDITKKQRKIESMIQQNKELQTRMYELSSAKRIRRIAEEELNMTDPEEAFKVVFYQNHTAPVTGEVEFFSSNIHSKKDLIYRNPNILIDDVKR